MRDKLCRKLLGAVLSLAVLCSALPVAAAAEELFAGLQTGSEAGKLAFETAGDEPWFRDSSLLDRAAYRSGNTLRNETSSQLTALAEGPCWIAFDYAYSSETDYDFFRVFVDGAEVQFDGEYTYTDEDGNQAATFGKTGDPGVRDTSELQWRFGQIELSGEGSHRVTWSYEKDMYSRGGLDAAWVANVRALSVQDTGTEHPAYQNLELQTPSISIRYDEEGGSVTAAGEFGVSGDIAPYTIYPFSRWKEEDTSDKRPTVTMTAVPKEGYIFEGWVSEDGTELYGREAECTFWVGEDFDLAARFTKVDTEVSILNTEGISFANDETYPWQRDDSFSGKLAFHSGNRGRDDTNSVLTANVTAEADCYLIFDWAASSEGSRDCLRVSVDGEDPVKLACDEALAPEDMIWGIKQIFIPAGTRQVTFSFVKDSSTAKGFDAAWIANPRLISEPEACEITFQFAAERGTVTGGPAGSGNPIEQGKAYSALKYDELPLCKAKAAEGYSFLGWWFDGVYQEDLGTSSFNLTPEQDYQIEARFLPDSARPLILLTSGGEPPADCSSQDWVIPHDVSDTERRYTFTVTDQPGFLTTAVVDGKQVSLEMEHEFSLQGIEASKDIVFTTAREGYADVVRTVRLQAQKTLAQQEAGVDSIVSTELSFPWQRDQEGRFYADGAVNNTGSNRLYTMAVTVTGNGVLKFQYETSCRTTSCLYYRTGEPLEGISTAQQKMADNYEEKSNFKGVHAKTPREIKIENKAETEQTTVYFSYYRTSSNISVKEDKVWLSDVEFIRQGLPRDLTVELDGAGYGSVSASTGMESHEFTREEASVWQVKTSSTVTLTAAPSEQGEFYGWFDESGSLISSNPVYSYFVLEDFRLKAKFAAAGSYTARSGNRFYPTIQEAVAGAAADSQVVLLRDYVLEQDLVIPHDVTLLLPCGLDDTGYLEKTGYNPDGTETNPTTGVSPKAKLFRTLTVPEGVTLRVEGTVLVNAVTGRPGAGHFDMDVTGGYGQIELGGEIQVSGGGVLDVCGYVKGDGTVTARPGGEVRDLYVVRNWRGGSQAFGIFPYVYPMNQADMHNLTAETRIEAGGSLVGTVKMYASGSYYYTRFPQVDSQNGLIRLKEGGAVVKTYDGESGREKLVLSGGGTVDSSTLEIVGMDLSTAGFLYPIDGDMDFELVSGDWTVNEQLKFMPGAQVLVKNGASLTIAEKTGHDGSLQNQVVFYDSFQPEDPKNVTTTAYPKDRGAAALTLEGGAVLTVNGGFAGQILPGQSASAESPVRIVTGENSGFTVSTLEANGYCNGTRELNFAAGLGAEAREMAAGESYLCYYEDGALVVKDRASQSFEEVCAALEAAVPPATSLTGEEALTDYAADWARSLVQDEAVTVTVEPAEGGSVEPEAGTAENPSGTDGSFAFTVTLSREGLEPYTTGVKTLAVTAAPYSPPSSGGGGGGSVTEEVVTNPDGSQTIIVTDTAAGTVTETTKGTDGSVAVKVTREDGSVTESRETASGAHAETEIGADGSVGIEARVPGTAIENGERSVETAAGTIALPEAAGGEISLVLRVEPSAGGIADIRLELRVNGVPLEDLSGVELRIDLKRLLEKEKQLSLRGAAEDAGEAGLLPELVAVEADRVLPRSYVAGTELVLRGMTGGTLRVEERAAEFGDVAEGFWGADEIAFAAARGLLQGTGPAEFSPEESLTRAMLMTVLARVEGVDTQGTPWYEKGIRWAVEAGVSDGSEPHAPITREQLVTMLYRYAGAQPGAADALSGFADGETASGWAADALGWAVEQGIVRGKEGGRIDPRGTATRAEAAAMLRRFLLPEA